MPRPVLILLLILVALVVVLFALASLDKEVPQTRIERPLTNAAAQ